MITFFVRFLFFLWKLYFYQRVCCCGYLADISVSSYQFDFSHDVSEHVSTLSKKTKKVISL